MGATLHEAAERLVALLTEHDGAYDACPTCSAVADVRAALSASAATASRADAEPAGWIRVEDRLPREGADVLVFYRYPSSGKGRVTRALHAPHLRLSEEDFGSYGDGGEYDEATDTTYWPEGWYETYEEGETAWQLQHAPSHWRPLPSGPDTTPAPAAGPLPAVDAPFDDDDVSALAWKLCEQDDNADPDHVLWEGGPTPEPWGPLWMKYEEPARELLKTIADARIARSARAAAVQAASGEATK